MRELDIRTALRDSLRAEHASDPDTAVIDELGLCQGKARVDMAVVNGSLHGYEIKSERDKLARLPGQRDVYNRCFDTMTLVASGNHLTEARTIIPKWWGIVRPVERSGVVEFRPVRRARPNPTLAAEAVVQLLWREEALEVLTSLDLAKGLRTKPRKVLWAALVQALSLDDLKAQARAAIKSRGDWRPDSRRVRGSGLSPISATPPDHLSNLSWLIAIGFQHPQH